MQINNIVSGSECRVQFRAAYENRYTWDGDFPGYKGNCAWDNGSRVLEGSFELGRDLKVSVMGINDEVVNKAITSQLWEVSVHRVRRSFEETHKLNTFTAGDINSIGIEIIVGGKNKGDLYRIKDNTITMVYRHIHGTLVTIYTKNVINTVNGYLSKSYSSQYSNPTTGEKSSGKNHYVDSFVPLYEDGPLVLSQRVIKTESFQQNPPSQQKFTFFDLNKLK